VLAQQVALCVDVEEGIVKAGVAGLGVAFVEAHYDVNAGFLGCPTEFLGHRAGNCYRLIELSSELPNQRRS
jgi:hypothetical protein